jgi:glycosyltransferase involved in cell wall biosynthesis
MKVVYLTWGETPRSYGVFGSQVVGQFVETAKLSQKDEYHFISTVPYIHSGLIREGRSYRTELNKVRDKLGGIAFHWLPIYAPQNFVNSSKNTFSLMHGLAHLHLKNKLRSICPDIVHCRSYHAAWAALKVRKKYNLNYKIIFDGRGLWPEEVALKRNWSDISADYQFLKSIENTLLTECDASVSVSDAMHEHYMNLGAKNDYCVYLSTDVKQLRVNINELKSDEIVRFCYVGALSEDTWHQPKVLVDLYRRLRSLFQETQLTIVTTSDHGQLKSQFSEFPQEELVFISTKTRMELKEVLKGQDFGLMAYFSPTTDQERLVANTVLAVKTAEYLIAGLPMICNEYCGGAARIILNNQLGITYFPEKLDVLTQRTLLPFLNQTARQKCQTFALENFDYAINAKKYLQLYKDILGWKI